MNPPQFIPSEYCLQCRGCCLFAEAKSAWCAHLTAEEEILLERRVPGVSFGGCLLTAPSPDGRHHCRCLNIPDHHCRVYDARPLECALYPFLLSSGNGALKLYVHSACPFVQAKRSSPEWATYVAGIRQYLSAPGNAGALKAACAACPDYSLFKDEAEFIADVPFSDGAAVLLARKAELDGWFSRRKPVLSSRSFVNVFIWTDVFDFDIEDFDGNKLVLARQHGAEFLYCPPLGEAISPRAVEAAFARMKGGAARIEAVSSDELAAFDEGRYRAHLQGEEYYYERARIAALAGNDHHSKRSDLNSFLRQHTPVFRSFVPSDAPACRDLFDRWLDKRRASYEDDIYRAMLVENRSVHRRMIDNAAALGVIGRVVELNGMIVGYTFGYPLNSETFCVALEVTEPGFKGLTTFIFREFCADAQVAPFKFINAMDDFGMPGVARAKRSWRPAHMENTYSICLKP
jgi:hypothetical protein